MDWEVGTCCEFTILQIGLQETGTPILIFNTKTPKDTMEFSVQTPPPHQSTLLSAKNPSLSKVQEISSSASSNSSLKTNQYKF